MGPRYATLSILVGGNLGDRVGVSPPRDRPSALGSRQLLVNLLTDLAPAWRSRSGHRPDRERTTCCQEGPDTSSEDS
jgi:hypothetical protein